MKKISVSRSIARGRCCFRYFYIKAGVFLSRKRIDKPADRIYAPGYINRGVPRGTLEQHVLYKVGYPLLLPCFKTRAGFDPDADGNRVNMLNLLGYYFYAVGEERCLNHVF